MPRTAPATLLTTLLALSAGCSGPKTPVEISFEARFDGREIDCGTADWALTDLRFFVHDLRLGPPAGERAIELGDEDRWQRDGVALVDLEDGTGACVNGTRSTNAVVRGTVALPAAAAGHTLQFSIGVPERLNHADPMRAAAPLNDTIMHWHWRSGYKFMRAGIAGTEDSSWLHLGSARCRGTIGDLAGCAASNRPLVRLTDFDWRRDVVVIDLARLFGPTGLDDGSPWSCESGVAETGCRLAFAELGIDAASGRALGPAPAIYARQAP